MPKARTKRCRMVHSCSTFMVSPPQRHDPTPVPAAAGTISSPSAPGCPLPAQTCVPPCSFRVGRRTRERPATGQRPFISSTFSEEQNKIRNLCPPFGGHELPFKSPRRQALRSPPYWRRGRPLPSGSRPRWSSGAALCGAELARSPSWSALRRPSRDAVLVRRRLCRGRRRRRRRESFRGRPPRESPAWASDLIAPAAPGGARAVAPSGCRAGAMAKPNQTPPASSIATASARFETPSFL